MKVLHLNPGLRPGGITGQAADLARGLQAAGIKNIVMGPASELIGALDAARVRHITCRTGGWLKTLAAVRKLRKTIISIAPDILQTYTPEAALMARLACMRLRRRRRPALVGVVTGFMSARWQRWAMGACDALVFSSRYLRKVMTERGFVPKGAEVWVIPGGVDESLCYPGYAPSADWMEQWHLTQQHGRHRYTLCVPCPISPLHGLEDLEPIMSVLLNNGLSPLAYIVGDSGKADPNYLESLRNHFAEAHLDERIIWLGHRPDLRDVICACDVTIYLSRRPESYNRPILEALSLGRPVAAYDHGVVSELLEAFLPEGRVEPDKARAMADVLLQWRTYRPSLPGQIPPPYRLRDTVSAYRKLYEGLR